MTTTRKYYYVIISLIYYSVAFAQMHTEQTYTKHKKKASAYDTNAFYYNKGKLNLCADIGFNGLEFGYTGSAAGSGYAAIAGVYGTPTSLYEQSFTPSYNITGSYGLTAKSTIGINATFMQSFFDPMASSPNTSEGKISMLYIGIRYAHCIRSWRFFYYGFQLSTAFVKANYDTNTFSDKPTIPVPSVQPMIGLFLGFRCRLDDNLWFHWEAQEHFPLFNTPSAVILINEMIGLNYSINTNKKTVKK